MHYDIHYSTDPADQAATDLKALCDMREYVGEEYWAKLGAIFFNPRSLRPNLHSIMSWLCHIDTAAMFCGVSGRPIRAYKRAFLNNCNWRAKK